MSQRFTSINGITIHVCRKLADFAFGKANAFAVRYNYPEMCYDIYVRETEITEARVEYFEDFWGEGFNVILLPADKIHIIPSIRGNVHLPV